jgi:hypothetical protein
MTNKVFLEYWYNLMNPIGRQQAVQREAVKVMFVDRDHARRVWDEWDGISSDPPSPNGEDAWLYLSITGDGAYCTV